MAKQVTQFKKTTAKMIKAKNKGNKEADTYLNQMKNTLLSNTSEKDIKAGENYVLNAVRERNIGTLFGPTVGYSIASTYAKENKKAYEAYNRNDR